MPYSHSVLVKLLSLAQDENSLEKNNRRGNRNLGSCRDLHDKVETEKGKLANAYTRGEVIELSFSILLSFIYLIVNFAVGLQENETYQHKDYGKGAGSFF